MASTPARAPIATFRPNGLPSWPMLLIAGRGKTGKSYAAYEASGSDLIGRTFVIVFGERIEHEYGKIPGARFEFVDLDAYGGQNYKGLMGAISAAIGEPSEDGKPNHIVVDSAGRVWNWLCDEADRVARVRYADKKKLSKIPTASTVADEITISSDLWNSATSLWMDFLDLLKTHTGPVTLTSLIEEVTDFKDGKPSKDRIWRISGQKRFSADVDVVVELPVYREAYVTGMRSMKWEMVETGNHTRENRFHDFTVDKLWRTMGMDGAVTAAQHATLTHDDGLRPTNGQDDRQGGDELAENVARWFRQATKPKDQHDVLDRLRIMREHFGDAVLDSVAFNDRESVLAVVLRGIESLTVSLNAARSQQPTQDTAPAPAPPTQPAPQAVAAAQQTAQDTRNPANDHVYACLADEISNQARVLGLPEDHYLSMLLTVKNGATSITDIHPAIVHRWVADQRPHVVDTLRAQGQATAADFYSRQPAQAFGMWGELTGADAHRDEDARAHQDATT